MEIIITQRVVDYINNNKMYFELDTPNVGDTWNVDRVTAYPNVNNGEPVAEISKGKSWMRLPVYLWEKGELAKQLEN